MRSPRRDLDDSCLNAVAFIENQDAVGWCEDSWSSEVLHKSPEAVVVGSRNAAEPPTTSTWVAQKRLLGSGERAPSTAYGGVNTPLSLRRSASNNLTTSGHRDLMRLSSEAVTGFTVTVTPVPPARAVSPSSRFGLNAVQERGTVQEPERLSGPWFNYLPRGLSDHLTVGLCGREAKVRRPLSK